MISKKACYGMAQDLISPKAFLTSRGEYGTSICASEKGVFDLKHFLNPGHRATSWDPFHIYSTSRFAQTGVSSDAIPRRMTLL
jgi:hypothetical protein